MGKLTFTTRPGYGPGLALTAVRVALVAAFAVTVFGGVRVVGALTSEPTGPASAEERIIDDALRVIKQDPTNVQARWQLSLALSTIGDYRQAHSEAEQAVELDGRSVEAFYALGVAYRGLGDLDRAEKAFGKAGSIPGSLGDVYREVYYDLGEVRMELGRYEEAVDAFERALASGPEATYVVIALADAHRKVGNTDRAIEEYLAVLGYDIENETALAALRELGVSESEIEAAKDVDGHGDR